jgi:hypothetical protein
MWQKNGCKRTIQKASFEKEVYVFYLSVSSVLKPEILGYSKAMGHLKIIYFLLAILAVL